MNPRIKATARFVKELRSILNNWEFWTSRNTGIYANKLRYYGLSGEYIWTKKEVIELIKKNKEYIRKELSK